MSAILTAYDCTTPWNALGRNPITSVELQPMIQEPDSILLGTRSIMATYANWSDNVAIGFGISEYEYIGMVIDFGLITITEDATYEFDLDSDDYGELWVDGTLVAYEIEGGCTTIPIALIAGSYSFIFKFQNGTGTYGFNIRWRQQGEVNYYPLDNSFLGMPTSNAGNSGTLLIEEYEFSDYPHKLTIKTQLDDEYVQRRVEIRNRVTGVYIASMITDVNGIAEFIRLPTQSLKHPHIITCFDDRTSEFLNALVYDRVYQLTDQGAPPET